LIMTIVSQKDKQETASTPQKPKAPAIHQDNIPLELKDTPRWVLWSFKQDDGKWTKVPVGSRGSGFFPINCHSLTNHKSFGNVLVEYQRARDYTPTEGADVWADGVGFVLSDADNIVGLDCDNCIKEIDEKGKPELDPSGRAFYEFWEARQAYIEISPSGKGLRAFVRGKLPENMKLKTGVTVEENTCTWEVYNTKRYFTVTGDIINPAQQLPSVTDEDWASYRDQYMGVRGTSRGDDFDSLNVAPVELSELDIKRLEHRRECDPALDALLNGDTSDYRSESEADLGMCCRLAKSFPDPRVIRTIWQEHGPWREKCEREDTYLQPTIGKALKSREPQGAEVFSNLETPEAGKGQKIGKASKNRNFHYSVDKKGKRKLIANAHNVAEYLRYYGRPIWFDGFTHNFMTLNEKRQHIAFDSRCLGQLQDELQDYNEGWRRISQSIVEEGMKYYAQKNERNQLTDYLTSLKWDGVPRIDTWLLDYTGADDNTFNREAGKNWLLGAVARAWVQPRPRGYDPGVKFDHCLVLIGKQGGGKSSILAALGKNWFVEIVEIVNQKDLGEKIRGKWIVEFSELSAMSKADANTMKSIISAQTDRFREAYGRQAEDFNRTCVLAGTTNNERFLSDGTGNRRYWPVAVADKLEFGRLSADRDQIWAEAVHRYKKGESFLLSEEALSLAVDAQDERYEADPWENTIRQFLAKQNPEEFEGLNSNFIAKHCLDIPKERQHTGIFTRIGKVMYRLGWKRVRLGGGDRKYVYKPGEEALVQPGDDAIEQKQAQQQFVKKVWAFEGSEWLAREDIKAMISRVCERKGVWGPEDVTPQERVSVITQLKFIQRIQTEFLGVLTFEQIEAEAHKLHFGPRSQYIEQKHNTLNLISVEKREQLIDRLRDVMGSLEL
jgi:hypothetical protein